MDAEIVVAGIAAGTAIVLAAIQRFNGSQGVRDRMQKDIQIWNELPDSIAAKSKMLSYIEGEVDSLVNVDGRRSWDPTALILAVIMVGLFGWLAYAAATADSWWIKLGVLPAGSLLIIGTFGFFQEVWPRRRDANGKIIRKPKTNRSAPAS